MDTKLVRAAARRLWNRAGDPILAAVLFAASLYLYLQTLAPSVAALFDDSLEFPLVAHRLAIAHPTGYPLYTLLAKIFTLGPWRNVAWEVNTLSAVAGALTVALVYGAARQLTRRRLPAFLGAAALAVSPVFWSQAVVAEVYTLAAAFIAGLLLLALRWARKPWLPVPPSSLFQVPPGEEESEGDAAGEEGSAGDASGEGAASEKGGTGPRNRMPDTLRAAAERLRATYRRFYPPVPPSRRLRPHPLIYALVALFGLSLTHHRITLLLAPALLLYLFLVDRRVYSRAALLGPVNQAWPRWQQLLRRPAVYLALCLLGPSLLYLYLPIRGATGSLDGTYVNTLGGFLEWVTASSYGAFFGDNPLARDLDAGFYAGLFWRQFGPVGLALALVGVVGLLRRPKELALTGIAFLSFTLFAVLYRVPDVEVFFIPAFLLVAVWIAAGLHYASDLLRVRSQSMALRRLLAVCTLLLYLAAILQPLSIALRDYPDLDRSQEWIVRDYGFYVLSQPLPPGSTVVGLLGEMTLLRYVQDTIGIQTGLATIVADEDPARLKASRTVLDAGGDLYLTRPLPGLADDYTYGAVIGLIDVAGDLQTLFQVGDPVYEAPELPREANLRPIPGLELLGYGVHEHSSHWQAWARLRLWWRAAQGMAEPFKVSTRLLDGEGRVVASTDAGPVAGAYPSNAWRPGEIVADAYEVPLPSGLPPGSYTPLVVIYEPGTGVELGRALLDAVHLQGNPTRPPRRALEAAESEVVYARFGDVELLGFTPPDPAPSYQAGSTLPLTLLWQADGDPEGDLSLSFWLEGLHDHALGTQPLGGGFPIDHWPPAAVVRQWIDLEIPPATPAGEYRLIMRVTRDGQPVPWGRSLLPLGSDLELGTLQLE